MTTVLVAIPAHDEAEELGECLRHLHTAVTRASSLADPPTVLVSLAAHRCVDETLHDRPTEPGRVPGAGPGDA